MSALGIKRGVGVVTPVLEPMRVWPLTEWNIWNINIYKKNIYRKQVDNRQTPISTDRNTVEHTGTTFQSLFQKCSAVDICRNTPQAPAVRGLRGFPRKRCSAMFQFGVPGGYPAESPVIRELSPFIL